MGAAVQADRGEGLSGGCRGLGGTPGRGQPCAKAPEGGVHPAPHPWGLEGLFLLPGPRSPATCTHPSQHPCKGGAAVTPSYREGKGLGWSWPVPPGTARSLSSRVTSCLGWGRSPVKLSLDPRHRSCRELPSPPQVSASCLCSWFF